MKASRLYESQLRTCDLTLWMTRNATSMTTGTATAKVPFLLRLAAGYPTLGIHDVCA